MPRIRSLKPDLWEDEALGTASLEARLLFVGLITQADDDGRLRGDPRLIGSQIFPYETPPPEQTEAWLAELDRAGLIQRYAHAGRPLICLPAWERHQKIDKPTRSRLPGVDDEGSVPLADPSASPRRAFDEPSPQEGKGEERKGKESEADASDVTTTSDPSSLRDVEERPRSGSPTAGRLSNLLADLIAANDPNGKRPVVTKRWLDAERLLVTRDGRKPDQVEALIRWVAQDDFERGVVLSMVKLRERFTGLWQKAQRKGGSAASRTDADVARLGEMAEAMRREEATA